MVKKPRYLGQQVCPQKGLYEPRNFLSYRAPNPDMNGRGLNRVELAENAGRENGH